MTEAPCPSCGTVVAVAVVFEREACPACGDSLATLLRLGADREGRQR